MYIYWCCRQSVHVICCPYFSILFLAWTSLSSTFSLPYQRKLSTEKKKYLYSYYFVPSDLILTTQQKLRIVGNFIGVSLFLEVDSLLPAQCHHIGRMPPTSSKMTCRACYCHVRYDSLNSHYHWWSQGVAQLLAAFKSHMHDWLLLSDDMDITCLW